MLLPDPLRPEGSSLSTTSMMPPFGLRRVPSEHRRIRGEVRRIILPRTPVNSVWATDTDSPVLRGVVGGAGNPVERERCVLVHRGQSCDQTRPQDLADVAHPQTLHHRPRARVVDLSERDDLLNAQDREGVIESGAADLGGIPAAPDFLAQRPAYLHALRAFDDDPGRTAPPDERAARLLVGQPLADPARPRALHPLGEAQRLIPAQGVPPGDALVLVEVPEFRGVPRVDRHQTQPLGPIHSARRYLPCRCSITFPDPLPSPSILP